MKCRLWHRWSAWRSEFWECPNDEWIYVVEVRTRCCKRCPILEEDHILASQGFRCELS